MPLLERMPLLEPTEALAEMPILQRMPQQQESEDVGVDIIDLTQDDDDCDVQEMPLPTSLLGVHDTIISDNCTSTELSVRPISLLFCNYL